MATAWPPTKIGARAAATRRKNNPKMGPADLGERGRTPNWKSTKGPAITDTTNTGKQTRTTVAQPGSMAHDKTKGIQKQKTARTKAKMKAKLRSAKPSGVTKVAKLGSAAKGLARGVPLLGAALALGSTAKKPAKSPPEQTRPLFKRKK